MFLIALLVSEIIDFSVSVSSTIQIFAVYFRIIHAMASSSKITFKCDNVERFTYLGSCEKYYFCWAIGEAHAVLTCPHRKAFDPMTRACVFNFAVCDVAPKCNFDKRILPNPNDKATFFACKFRFLSKKFVLRKHDCAAGREFDAALGYCKSKFHVLEDDIPSDGDSDSFEHVECEKPGIFIGHYHSNECEYYECIVKSVSRGTLKLIRHRHTDHMFKIGENDNGVELQRACFKIQLLTCLAHIMFQSAILSFL